MYRLSVDEAASRLGRFPITIGRLIKRGQLPHARPVGRAVRVPQDAVEAILAQWLETPDPASLARRAS